MGSYVSYFGSSLCPISPSLPALHGQPSAESPPAPPYHPGPAQGFFLFLLVVVARVVTVCKAPQESVTELKL